MVYEIINIILTIIGLIIALGGGVSGFIALFLYWKKSQALFKIISSTAGYFIDKSNLVIDISMNVINEKDTVQSITDLVASIRFDKQRKIKNMPKAFSVSPIFPINMPINIQPNHSESISMKFVFPEVDVPSIDRLGTAKFVGIINNTPVLVANENDFNEKWNELPLLVRVDLHINGTINLNTIVGAHKLTKSKMISGTLTSIDVGKIQHQFINNFKINRESQK